MTQEKQPSKAEVALQEIGGYLSNLNGPMAFHNNNAAFLNPRLQFLYEEACAAEILRGKVQDLEKLLAAKEAAIETDKTK